MNPIILTTYLTQKPDPQRGGFVTADDPARLELVDGCNTHGVRCIIFHDGLSPEFVKKHTSASIHFESVAGWTSDLSTNDIRFLMYRDWLHAHKPEPDDILFFSDLFDVRLNRHPRILPPCPQLWVGIHRDWTIDPARQTEDEQYVCREMYRVYGSIPPCVIGQPILMAGTWGGPAMFAVPFLEKYCDEILKTTSDGKMNTNLVSFNVCAYREIGRDGLWLQGAPLHSEFRLQQHDAPVVFVHK